LTMLLEGTTWDGIRSEYWHGMPAGPIAMGYRLDIAGGWSEPDETLEDSGVDTHSQEPENPEIPVVFKDSSGRDCGRHVLRFLSRDDDSLNRVFPGLASSTPTPLPHYLINNADLGDVLRIISLCAVTP